MTETKPSQASRPDIDIEHDLPDVFNGYPPLLHDRSRLSVDVQDGVVTLSGYVKTVRAREYFEQEAAKIPGVKAVDVSETYDDEALRIKSGQVTPMGIYTMVSYGAVVLTGERPEGVTDEELVQKVEAIPGVRKVLLNLR